MILQALHGYYLRKTADPDPARRLPAFGREDKEIPFILELSADGQLVGIKDTRTGSGKDRAATRFLVPKGVKKTSGVSANLLWDNAEYVFGTPDAKKQAEAQRKGKADGYVQRLRDMQAAFKARIDELPAGVHEDAGIRAVLAFIGNSPAESLAAHAAGVEIAETNPVLTFRLIDDDDLVCQRPAVSTVAVQASSSSIRCLPMPKHLAPVSSPATRRTWSACTRRSKVYGARKAPVRTSSRSISTLSIHWERRREPMHRSARRLRSPTPRR